VFEVASAVDASLLKPAGFACPFRPSALLALIVYCYAAGIYASREIESRLHRHDGITRLLCGPELLDRQVIRRFRRDNAAMIVWCLSRTLAPAFGSGRDAGNLPPVSGNDRPGPMTGTVLTTEAPATAEARRRVERAVFLDSLDL
jgi:hypothetical protein